MSNNYFKFKQFTVFQENVSMRVNTDGVLLGVWASLPNTTKTTVLDVGTGTGVIALMIAQRLNTKADITAIDIDEPSVNQAAENFEQSKWQESLTAQHVSLQDFVATKKEEQFDLIISNPPYFNNALKNPQQTKRSARHTDSLSYQELTEAAKKLLKPNGILSVIIPYDEFPTMQRAVDSTLQLVRLCKVFTLRQDKEPKRLLLEYKKHQNNQQETNNRHLTEETLCIMEDPATFTEEYKSLTKDFYLKF